MAKEKLFKNVLRGHIGRTPTLEFLVVVDTDNMNVMYCGDLEAFQNCDLNMIAYQREIEKRNVKKVQTIGTHKLIIFV